VILGKNEMGEILSQVVSVYGDGFVSLYDEIEPVKKERKIAKIPVPPKEKRVIIKHNLTCKTCGFEYIRSHQYREQQYCSQKCVKKSQEKFSISKEELEDLIWKYPSSTLSKMLGVSDKAIEKRCKKYDINKPPRGFWSKQR
jgi:hypothetical protein